MQVKLFFKRFKYKDEAIFLLLLVTVSLVYGYSEIIQKGPYSLHMWRQCDCLSFTSNYYHENKCLFEPTIHWSGYRGDGQTVSEFPILYYLNAQLWKIFGQEEFISRLINILIVFSGLFLLFKTFKNQIQNSFWSILPVIFLFTSPLLIYYTNNFLTDAPAFGFALIGLFFIWKYYHLYKLKYLYFSLIFFMIAGLLKISSIMGLLGILPIHLYLLLFDKEKRIKPNTIIPFVILFMVLALWYYFAVNYNKNHIGCVFLQGILPMWDINTKQINAIYNLFTGSLLPQFMNKKALLIIFSMWVFSLIHFKSANKFLLFYSLFIFIGTIGYLVLFYQVFTVHDYYLTNLLITIPLVLILFLDLVKRKYPRIFKSTYAKIFFSLGVLYLILLSAQINRQKYFTYNKDFIVKHGILKHNESRDWYHHTYSKTYKALEEITPYLRELGIERTDKVISIPDESPNKSLYLMDQKGFTDFVFNELEVTEKMNRFIHLGAKYIIINDTSIFSKRAYLKEYTSDQIGEYKNVHIYKLK